MSFHDLITGYFQCFCGLMLILGFPFLVLNSIGARSSGR